MEHRVIGIGQQTVWDSPKVPITLYSLSSSMVKTRLRNFGNEREKGEGSLDVTWSSRT